MHEIDRIRVAAESAAVYEHGWQSWSPSVSYRLHARPLRPGTENSRIMNWRPDTRPPADAFWGENLAAMDDLGLGVDVVQIDDGYQAEIGDWLTESGRFASLEAAVARIRGTGRRAGLWLAPFLVSPRSRVYQEHPEWLLGGTRAGSNWKAEQAVLDVTHPGAEEYLRRVFGTLRRMGIDYFKLDFLYAGALAGHRADDTATPLVVYRHGMELIREVIGPDSYLLGCGAPILPSVGLVDAMRVSPDTAPHYEPDGDDLSMPSQRAAALTGRARAWQHGRFWANDADCLIVRPQVQRRDAWATHIDHYGGLRSSSDRLRDLDDWGLSTTRRLLRRTPVRPFADPSGVSHAR